MGRPLFLCPATMARAADEQYAPLLNLLAWRLLRFRGLAVGSLDEH
jgi:hypothetical protein